MTAPDVYSLLVPYHYHASSLRIARCPLLYDHSVDKLTASLVATEWSPIDYLPLASQLEPAFDAYRKYSTNTSALQQSGTIRIAHLELSTAYSPDGRYIISKACEILNWDAETGAPVGDPLKALKSIFSVAYSPDGHDTCSGSNDRTIRIWDAKTGAAVGGPLEGHKPVFSVAYSPDGQTIISGSNDRTLRIWDAKTGAVVGNPLEGHKPVFSVAYSPDGHPIVSGSNDRTLRIWDAKTGAVVGGPLEGHTGRVRSVAYSTVGQCIISGSEDSTIRTWNTETSSPVDKPLEGRTDWVQSVVYSSNGRHTICGSSNYTIRICDAARDAATGAAVCNPLNRHSSISSLNFVTKTGIVGITGGTARKNRFFHHHPRRNLRTAVLPRAFRTNAPGDSEESYGVPPNAHLSKGSSSGRPSGDSWRSVSGQPSCTSVYDLLITHQSNEGSKPDWDGSRLQKSTIRNDNAVDGELPVLLYVNPRRGSTSGGEEIYLIVKNPPSTTVLYARFGCNIAPTSHIADGVLACHLPPGTHPGVVDVTLCQAPSVHEKSYGKSLVSFEYDTDTSKAVALLSTSLSGTLFTEVTPGNTQGPTIEYSDPTHSATKAPSSFPESAFIEVLAAFKSLPDFEQRLSTMNIYRQSLLHLAVHLRYRQLVQRLVDWGIDLDIKDVNGFTALHTAYLCGDPSITRTLEQHGTIQLSLDILGRPPLELASGATKALEDHDLESHLSMQS